MRKTAISVSVIVMLFVIGACQKTELESLSEKSLQESPITFKDGEAIPGQYIIMLEDAFAQSRFPVDRSMPFGEIQARMQGNIQKLLQARGIRDAQIIQVFTGAAIHGFSARLSDNEVKSLRGQEGISLIEPDRYVLLNQGNSKGKKPGGGDGGEAESNQSTPWGITRVGGSVNMAGSAKKAWVLDTGIDYGHSDLNVNQSLAFTVFSSGPDSKDGNDAHGHGTHVSGTIGAINNSIGVVGVAAGISLVPVKVLDRRGSGTVSGVIAGVDYVAAKASTGDVANMSLGGGYSQSLNNAVINAASKGLYFSIAAGNSGNDAQYYSPASASGGSGNIYTICAVNSLDAFASFSNYSQSLVSFCAPGVSVHSTWKGNSYNTLNGTSMAAPHVAGILLVNGNSIKNGGTTAGPDGNYAISVK